MQLIRYRPVNSLGALETLQDEINKLFEFPFGLTNVENQVLAPSVDVWEDKDNIYVEADVPGVDGKDLKVNVKNETLVISGKKEETREENLPAGKAGKKGYFKSERFQGSFYRAIGLPSTVDTAKIKAQYKKGVLKVALPKKEKEQGKDITSDVE